MGQPLRITHHQQDYAFQLLTEQIDATTQEIAVQVGEAVLTLVKTERSWMPKAGEHDEMSELAQAIGKAIALRYRI